VIAFLPGTKGAKKTIVFTAHYDHLGRMGELTYFPGANDNASGTAMLLTLAKYFKEHPVNVNILFIAFAGEEAGLLGSEHFVNHPTYPLKKMNFLVNLDIMGSGEEGITVVNATLFNEQFKLLQEINTEKGLLTQVKSRGPAQNSDHYWFTEKGVPAFFIYTMGSNKNYHDVFDTYENLTFSEYNDITTLLSEFVLRLP
jgi:Zn-dependent M28 family amino/carboxypeptidase